MADPLQKHRNNLQEAMGKVERLATYAKRQQDYTFKVDSSSNVELYTLMAIILRTIYEETRTY